MTTARDRHPPGSPAPSSRLERLASYFSPRPRRPLPGVGGNHVELLINGNEIFSAMLHAILTARDSVDVEMYIWRDDEIGQRFARLLAAKAAEGLRVRVIFDSVGSWFTPRRFWDQLEQAGVRVGEFNPVTRRRGGRRIGLWRRLRMINHRDHRKIVLVDGQVGFVGGMNIAREYVGDATDARHWRDTGVQIRGPILARLGQLFERQWRRVTGERPARPIAAPPRPQPAGDHWAIAIAARAWRSNLIQRAILTAIRRSRRQVEITMAYFSPPPRLTRALRRAARRGVKVRLILPNQSDVPPVLYAGRAHYANLLRAGVEIYECMGTILHAKTIQVDGVWGTVGSANLDLRSIRMNDEVNLFVLGVEFAAQLHAMFEADLARSRRIDRKQWKNRPRLEKLREWVCRLFWFWM